MRTGAAIMHTAVHRPTGIRGAAERTGSLMTSNIGKRAMFIQLRRDVVLLVLLPSQPADRNDEHAPPPAAVPRKPVHHRVARDDPAHEHTEEGVPRGALSGRCCACCTSAFLLRLRTTKPVSVAGGAAVAVDGDAEWF